MNRTKLLTITFAAAVVAIFVTESYRAAAPPDPTVLNVPGITLGNTNIYRDNGTTLTRNGTPFGGGDTIWTNSAGTILPATGQTTNTFQFTSGLADGASAVASTVGTVNGWSTPGSMLANWKNGGTNAVVMDHYGGVMLGRSAPAIIGQTTPEGVGYAAYANGANGESFTQIDVAWTSDLNKTNKNDFFVSLADGGPTEYLAYTYNGNDYLDKTTIADGDIDHWMQFAGSVIYEVWPSSPDGNYVAHFGTTRSHTSGNLLEVFNQSTNAFSVGFDGSISAGSTNQWKLAGVTNKTITVNLTNTAIVTIDGRKCYVIIANETPP